jgi:hypothetical protein
MSPHASGRTRTIDSLQRLQEDEGESKFEQKYRNVMTRPGQPMFCMIGRN